MSSNEDFLIRTVVRILIILIPITLVLSSVFIVLYGAGIWVPIEYRMPSFPKDQYGFDLEDRLYWSSVDIEFLLNNVDISYFDSYFLSDGTPMHNARELKHIQDVQVLLNIAKQVLLGGWILIILLGVVLRRMSRTQELTQALQRGARITLIIIGVLIVGIIVAFSVVFIGFHRIFFEGDSWLFSYSDTFIRLYPQRFWRDCFILLAIVTIVEAFLIDRIGKYVARRVSTNTA